MTARAVAVVGGGWAGIAAAVHASTRGAQVSLFEMAPRLGGRARRADVAGLALDNGQHILIGAYRETLAMMRTLGVDPDTHLWRHPLALVDAQGHGLRLPPGPPALAFVRAVLARTDWDWAARTHLLFAAAGWAARRFRCPPDWTVSRLCRALPAPVQRELIEPLCVAALNTPAERASAQVFLRVLRDGLFGGPGSADLLLPRAGLDKLLPGPGLEWLQARGACVQLGARVKSLAPNGTGWLVDGAAFDGVVLAGTAVEAARLTRDFAPEWSAQAAALTHEPIITVYLRAPGRRLPFPMLALRSAPAQFVFDLGALQVADSVFAAVISGAAEFAERSQEEVAQAVLAQLALELAPCHADGQWQIIQVITERRATLACTPGLVRPQVTIAGGLAAAGDFVDGPYPSTLEGAIRSGKRAVDALLG